MTMASCTLPPSLIATVGFGGGGGGGGGGAAPLAPPKPPPRMSADHTEPSRDAASRLRGQLRFLEDRHFLGDGPRLQSTCPD